MLLFFDISGGELLLILFVAFLVFGPSKLPELARKLGKGMNEIRRASDEIKREIRKEADKLDKDDEIRKANPLQDLGRMTRDIEKPLRETTDEINKPVAGKTSADEAEIK